MSKSEARKADTIKKYQLDAKDTGSAPVQIAVLTDRIKELTEHMKIHKKDVSSRRGLLKLVSQRRSLMAYLKNKDDKAYAKLIEDLGIRG